MNINDIKITRSHRRSISMQVLSDGSLEVKAPYLMPRPFIRKFIEKHSRWIEKRLSEANIAKRAVKKYKNNEIFTFLGKDYSLKFGNYAKIELSSNRLLFPIGLSYRSKEELEKWYLARAKEIITDYVNSYAEKMNTKFNSIRFSNTKSKWGSCTHDNRLQFNWRLILAPLLVVRYVIIHELAHTKEKNHSKNFWKIVHDQNPSYKEQIKWLKKNGNGLVV